MTQKIPKSSLEPLGTPLFYKSHSTSTMDDARKALAEGALSGTVCQAGHQSAGRGRLPGRLWLDKTGTSLLFTLIISKEQIPHGPPLTQYLALALCHRLEKAHGLLPRIKWPNDVLVEGRKIGGILVECESHFFLGGLGLNLRQKTFPKDFRRPGTSIFLETARYPLPSEELSGILQELRLLLCETSIHSLLTKRLDGLREKVTLFLGDPKHKNLLRGFVEGLSPDGALLVRDKTGKEHQIYSGEIVTKDLKVFS